MAVPVAVLVMAVSVIAVPGMAVPAVSRSAGVRDLRPSHLVCLQRTGYLAVTARFPRETPLYRVVPHRSHRPYPLNPPADDSSDIDSYGGHYIQW